MRYAERSTHKHDVILGFFYSFKLQTRNKWIESPPIFHFLVFRSYEISDADPGIRTPVRNPWKAQEFRETLKKMN